MSGSLAVGAWVAVVGGWSGGLCGFGEAEFVGSSAAFEFAEDFEQQAPVLVAADEPGGEAHFLVDVVADEAEAIDGRGGAEEADADGDAPECQRGVVAAAEFGLDECGVVEASGRVAGAEEAVGVREGVEGAAVVAGGEPGGGEAELHGRVRAGVRGAALDEGGVAVDGPGRDDAGDGAFGRAGRVEAVGEPAHEGGVVGDGSASEEAVGQGEAGRVAGECGCGEGEVAHGVGVGVCERGGRVDGDALGVDAVGEGGRERGRVGGGPVQACGVASCALVGHDAHRAAAVARDDGVEAVATAGGHEVRGVGQSEPADGAGGGIACDRCRVGVGEVEADAEGARGPAGAVVQGAEEGLGVGGAKGGCAGERGAEGERERLADEGGGAGEQFGGEREARDEQRVVQRGRGGRDARPT